MRDDTEAIESIWLERRKILIRTGKAQGMWKKQGGLHQPAHKKGKKPCQSIPA